MANWVICLPVLVVRLGLGELVGLRFRIVEQCFFFGGGVGELNGGLMSYLMAMW